MQTAIINEKMQFEHIVDKQIKCTSQWFQSRLAMIYFTILSDESLSLGFFKLCIICIFSGFEGLSNRPCTRQ
uniref:Uncharacterized protein n=1 Tax=Anguilla anguilla TaxID=7936 RepID=A0A0E9WY18_ANGAN